MDAELKKGPYTDRSYWENYYRKSGIDTGRVERIVGEYDRYWNMLIGACRQKPATIIEIGAYPGRYLAFLASRYNLRPAALDFHSDFSRIEDCMKAYRIPDYELIQADFTTVRAHRKYDLVISNGFVEHFENYNEILDRHVDFLAPGGAMLIMVPNMRYLRKWYGLAVDRKNLLTHNLKVMDTSVFRKFAERNNLELVCCTYYGGFPYGGHQKRNRIQEFIYRTFRFVFKKLNPVIRKHPNRFLSSTIITIYRNR